MATTLKNLSETTLKEEKVFRKFCIGIVVSEWNQTITEALLEGALEYLRSKGVKEKNILIRRVPGSFELPLGAQFLAAHKEVDGILALGCVIQGETRHFDFICDAVAHGIMDVGLTFNKPVAFGVLTTENEAQAKARAGGKLGNKGIEAAETVLKMLLTKAAG